MRGGSVRSFCRCVFKFPGRLGTLRSLMPSFRASSPSPSRPLPPSIFIGIFMTTIVSAQTVLLTPISSPAARFNPTLVLCQPPALLLLFTSTLCPSPLSSPGSSLPPCPTEKQKGSSSACIPLPPRPHSALTFTTLSGFFCERKNNLADGRRLQSTGGILK